MADDATAVAAVDAHSPTVTPTHSSEPPRSNGKSATPVDKKEESQVPDDEDARPASSPGEGKAREAASASAEPSAATATSSTGDKDKDKKRKSTGGVPEHKSKKLNKKKSMPTLHLDCKPGQFYWARLKGYPPWPSVICDESMLPESLLATRPVSTARPDGSLRDDFKEGGKNAKERTFPIMFLYTNEFQWMINTNLTPLDPEECKNPGNGKMAKTLASAYKVAAENHDLDYFKKLLRTWQEEEEAIREEQEALAAEQERLAAEKAAKGEDGTKEEASKPKKKAPRKSKVADDEMDMEEVEAPKSTKKRKKEVESDADGPKPKKTPKVTKLNGPKTPNGEASTTKKSTKRKVVSAPKEAAEDTPQMTEAERLAQREKAILYLRHRLQKGFLSRDQAPKEEEMSTMAEFFTQLQAYENLEPSIIRTTKIHKVLKAIVKLASVPKDEEFHFKKRSSAMLEIWNKRMESEGEGAAPASGEKQEQEQEQEKSAPTESLPERNRDKAASKSGEESAADEADAKPTEGQDEEMESGDASDQVAEKEAEKKADDAEDETVDKTDESEPVKSSEPVESTEEVDVDGDVSMQTAPEEA